MTKNKEPLFHLSKRTDVNKKQAWMIRVGAFLFSIILCSIISIVLTKKGIGDFFNRFFVIGFGSGRKILELVHDTSLFLVIALAVTPCFKMKFWNIGGEGQMLMGAVGCAIILRFCGPTLPTAATIIISLMVAIAFGIVWAVIPAIFKAFWNTNETLLTLMMNYIASCLTVYAIYLIAPKSNGYLSFRDGIMPEIFGSSDIFMIIVAVLVTLFFIAYLNKSKHGYELTVVGESENTAKYIGINTKKVIIRTLILCGAVCGIVGFAIVSAIDYSINPVSTIGGRGFTGVMLSWLAHFNPLAMILTSFLYVFIDMGFKPVASGAGLGKSYSSIMTGIFFFCIIASEFFINYKIILRDGEKIRAFFEQKVFKKKAIAVAVQDAEEKEEK